MSKLSRLQRKLRQNQLLKLFDGDFYQEKQIDGRWYIKQFNGKTKKWQVAEYSPESYMKYKIYNENKKIDREFNLALEKD